VLDFAEVSECGTSGGRFDSRSLIVAINGAGRLKTGLRVAWDGNIKYRSFTESDSR
jgi:hypothetical protein